MNAISVLKNEYPGDDSWFNYVSVFSKNWNNYLHESQDLSLLADKQLAAIISTKMGKNANIWFFSPCPALESRTPKEVLENEPSGNLILRTLLMRMPT